MAVQMKNAVTIDLSGATTEGTIPASGWSRYAVTYAEGAGEGSVDGVPILEGSCFAISKSVGLPGNEIDVQLGTLTRLIVAYWPN
jgi:hypothetical protein